MQSSRKLHFLHRTVSSGLVGLASSNTYNDGAWHLVVISFDLASQTIALDIDGGAERKTTSAADRLGNTVPFVIGRHSTISGGFWNGFLDEVAFFNAAPTASQCVELYNNGYALDLASYTGYSSLVSWWRNGDSPGDNTDPAAGPVIIHDAKSTHDATPINMGPGSIVANVPSTYTNSSSIIFDGTNDALTAPASSSLGGPNRDYSVAFWFNTGSVSASDRYIVKRGSDFIAYLDSSHQLRFSHRTTVGFSGITSVSTYNDGAWHFGVISFDLATQTIALDIDGGTERLTAAAVDRNGNSADLFIAQHSASTGNWDGNIDEVAFFDSALSASQCIEIYNGGTPKDLNVSTSYPNLISWWRMGDGPGDSTDSSNPSARIYDVHGSNDLTPQNMTAGDIVADVP